MKKILVILTIYFFVANYLFAQNNNNSTSNEVKKDKYFDWFNKSPIDDFIYGAEVNKAYEQLLQSKESTTVIVAVIDGGIDVNHEDLKDNIWINQDEIPDNGIDDDYNGYVDDINGWNFIGNSKGENISYENLEITRIYKQNKDKFENVKSNQLSDSEKETYKLYLDAKKRYEKALKEANKNKEYLENFKRNYNSSYDNIAKAAKKEVITLRDLDSLKIHNKELKKDIKFQYNFVKYGFNEEIFDEFEVYVNEELNYHLNIDFNPRDIIGDNPTDIEESYGNNNVYGPEADHGTFVAGIIAANRNNEKGIKGIVENVKIIALKAVPNGDERDKDIAKAIRYAVDNGARIINMSFGKELSPYKYLVDEAILYAQKKGVLIIHAAGNDGNNIDKVKQFPTPNINGEFKIDNYISVGASAMNHDLKFAANFSNYGKEMVDIFAPGVRIKSLAPESNYDIADGTSFSSPIVSGVAALVLSYYPDLNYKELKDILLKSAITYPDHLVYKPGAKKKKVEFGELSVTGGIVSAYQALNLAEKLNK